MPFKILFAPIALIAACSLMAQETPYKFSTTVFGKPLYAFDATTTAHGLLRGDIYYIARGSQKLPDFRKLTPVGSIYTPFLCVPPRSFSEGFPGVTDRFEWFAIDYNGRFWVSTPGTYRFSLASDDGSILYIDGKQVIQNDRQHPVTEKAGRVHLKSGAHDIRLSYFQGPRFHVALVLRVAWPGSNDLHVFDTEDFPGAGRYSPVDGMWRPSTGPSPVLRPPRYPTPNGKLTVYQAAEKALRPLPRVASSPCLPYAGHRYGRVDLRSLFRHSSRGGNGMGLALILLYIALNLLSPGDMFPLIAPFRPLLVLAVANLPAAFISRLRAPEIGKLRLQLVLVLMFFGYASCAWLPHGWLYGNVLTLLDMTPNVIGYFLGIIHFRTPQRLRFARLTLVGVALFILFNAFMEMPLARATGDSTPYVMAHMETAIAHSEVVNQTEVRIEGLGTLHDPNTFGQFLLLILPLLFVAKSDRGLGIGLIPAVLTSVLFIVGVYFTGSRGAYLGLVVIVGLFAIRRFKKTGALIAMAFGSVAMIVGNAYRSRGVSLSEGMDRLAIWSDGMAYFKSQPLWGIGPRQFEGTQGMTAHNSYLLVAAEMGFIGLFLWLAPIVVTFIQLGKIPKIAGDINPGVARWATGLRISLAGYMFTSFFLSRAYELPLFMLLGMSGGVIIASGGDKVVPVGNKWPVWTLVLCVGVITLIYVMLRMRAV